MKYLILMGLLVGCGNSDYGKFKDKESPRCKIKRENNTDAMAYSCIKNINGTYNVIFMTGYFLSNIHSSRVIFLKDQQDIEDRKLNLPFSEDK